jgi:hypothetical protein
MEDARAGKLDIAKTATYFKASMQAAESTTWESC